ncbi:hypothetical protein LZ198_25165 [Myxococcus sp. K15C18031901]|uniref:hypothetical protein n=1 Tax=Myxococcus dinghuensis TaxID=2906761 RepID=UPI0020A7E4D8|nr:hypothetical protein [Myxococcus dinghuensis]MCP3102163.1 hypothetical protein [Myxococcus dinghuensis]
MLKPLHLLLLTSLMADGGTPAPKPAPPSDAGTSASATDSIRWPKDLRPLATLDGPAVLAAHAALQQVLSRFPKERSTQCESSAKSLDVVVGLEDGVYFVRVDRRPDRCGWPPGASLEFDWFELYAVTPEGRILARHPSMP